MLATDEDAVICDFAETYHVLDYRALDLPLAATLAAGLAPDSRIMRKMSGASLPTDTLLLAAAVDNLAFLAWAQTEDGTKNRNRPKSILAAVTGKQQERQEMSFATGADFEAYREMLLRNMGETNG